MGRAIRVTAALFLVFSASGCSGALTDALGGSKAKPITTSAEAKALATELRAIGEAIDRQLGLTFTGPRSLTGVSGTASVSGKKTATSSLRLTTRLTDLNIAFSDYQSALSSAKVSGTFRWFNSYTSQTSCSQFACASDVDETNALIGTSIRVEFQYAGETYVDDVSVEVRKPEYSSTWRGKITTRDGTVLSF